MLGKLLGKRANDPVAFQTFAFSTDSPEAFAAFLEGQGSEADRVRVGKDRHLLSSQGVELEGMSFSFNRVGSRMLLREAMNEDTWTFGFLLPGSPAINYQGVKIPENHAFMFAPYSDHDYVAESDTASLTFALSVDFLKKLGWSLTERTHYVLSQPNRDALITSCRRMLDRLTVSPKPTPTEFMDLYLGSVDCLERAVAQWMDELSMDATHNSVEGGAYFVFRMAERTVRELAPDYPSAPELAEKIGVSERTLFRAFKEWVGIGPHEYFTLLRLQEFRRRLLKGENYRGKVGVLAAECGIDHQGRLGQLYKKHYGETPGQTAQTNDSIP